MKRIEGTLARRYASAAELKESIGKTLTFAGRVYKVRKMSGFAFVLVQLRDGLVQCLWDEASGFDIEALAQNAHGIFFGECRKDERSRAGFEVYLKAYTPLSAPLCEPPVVINGKGMNVAIDTLLDYRPITLRNAKERAIFKVQSALERGFRAFLEAESFTAIHSPKIVFSGAEGGANIFSLDYFGKKAYLAQSPQFYKQIMTGVYERVYEIAPVFRAEKHHTSRHVNEYTSVDLEMGFIESFYDVMATERAMIEAALAFVRENCAEELFLLGAEAPDASFIPALRFDEAKEILKKQYGMGGEEPDFEPEEEKRLSEYIKKETGSDFVFVTHYPSEKRSFYAMDTPGEPAVTESFDLLFRGLEVTTGGQRIHDYQEQTEKMRRRGMDVEAFSSYLMAHRHGLPPHGGLGLGLERFTARLLGFDNVRRAVLFPRDTERLEP